MEQQPQKQVKIVRRCNAPVETRFQPGKSGNPGGRPKGIKNIRELIEKYGMLEAPESILAKIREQFPKLGKKTTLHDAVIIRTYLDALSGDDRARDFIAERTEGKVKQQIEADIRERATIFNVKSEAQRDAIEKGNANADNI